MLITKVITGDKKSRLGNVLWGRGSPEKPASVLSREATSPGALPASSSAFLANVTYAHGFLYPLCPSFSRIPTSGSHVFRTLNLLSSCPLVDTHSQHILCLF